MLKSRFQLLLKEQADRLHQLTASKGEEYAPSPDQLHNFKSQAAELGTTPEKILGVYLNKHLTSIKGYIKDAEAPLAEPIRGRIDDAILYLTLLAAMVVEKEENRRSP